MLAAGFSSDLVAFETFTPGAPPRWRFHAGGTVYGQPAYDREGGRVYFGASDKRLYALDPRGLFLWSFETKDNVAARPLVVDELVVAAGEDARRARDRRAAGVVTEADVLALEVHLAQMKARAIEADADRRFIAAVATHIDPEQPFTVIRLRRRS